MKPRNVPLSLLTVGLLLPAILAPCHGWANSPPQAEDDVYITGIDEPLSLPAPGVLDNDLDSDHDALEAVLETDPDEGGTLDFRADGSFDYSPPAGYEGNVAFFYRAFDGTDLSDLGEVTIRVGGTPEPFTIHRSSDPGTVSDPGNDLGTTGERAWSDLPPPGEIFYYRISAP